MHPTDVGEVSPEHTVFDGLLADKVVRHEEELLRADQGVVLLNHHGEVVDRSGLRMVLQERVEDGHEVALAGTERAVEVGRLAAAVVESTLDEGQGLVEPVCQLGGYDIVAKGSFGVVHALGEVQHEVALVDGIGNLDDFGDQRHGGYSQVIVR